MSTNENLRSGHSETQRLHVVGFEGLEIIIGYKRKHAE